MTEWVELGMKRKVHRGRQLSASKLKVTKYGTNPGVLKMYTSPIRLKVVMSAKINFVKDWIEGFRY